MAEMQPPSSPPPHFIVIVPGYMGSKLRDKKTGEIVWLDIPGLLRNPLKIGKAIDSMLEKMAYPNDDLEPAGILDQVLFVPPWAKQEHYGRLLNALANMGYQIEPEQPTAGSTAVYTFPYDWRQDNSISAQQLGEAVAGWRKRHNGAKAWLIGHSNGGIVARWYIEKEGGKDHVDRLFLMGSPWNGAPKALWVHMNGLTVLGLRRFNLFGIETKVKQLIRTLPSFYQLLPYADPFLRDENKQTLDLFTDTSWLLAPDDNEALLKGQKFNRDLGTNLSVDTVCFFGRQKPTLTGGIVRRGPDGSWLDVQWTEDGPGDGTVPELSAVHRSARAKYAFAVDHGSIYVDPQTLPQLQWELIGQYRQAERARLVTDELTIQFEPDQDIYSPGETIGFWATVHSNEDGRPVKNAQVNAQLLWYEALPGQEQSRRPASPPQTRLKKDPQNPGRYTGSFSAPRAEGYYQLQAVVVTPRAPVILNELVAVEAEPAPQEA